MLKRLRQGWEVQNSPCSHACSEILGLLVGPWMLRWREGRGLHAHSIGSDLLLRKGENSYFDTAPLSSERLSHSTKHPQSATNFF